jgi:DNA repair exonuclease SbcCD nuclease subunit
MLCINDLHLGVCRAGGTTPQSQAALRDNLRLFLAHTLGSENGGVTVNGDLFDSFTVDTNEVVKTAVIFTSWLEGGSARTLNLISGNHDYNPRGDKLSSFHLLTHILDMSTVGHRVFVFDDGIERVGGSVWCIPSMPNQALFDIEIEKATNKPESAKYLLLHCNYKNGFAENSDHSLNINDDQVGALMRAGWDLILGHEHQPYDLRGGRVVVVGDQVPSSIADCLGNKTKRMVRVTDEGLKFEETWSAEGSYVEANWRDLPDLDGYQFIRVTGDATALEAADVIKVVSKLRQRSEAFVVSSAVKIEGHSMSEEMAETSIESIKSFDILASILAELNEQEQEVVKGLLKC